MNQAKHWPLLPTQIIPVLSILILAILAYLFEDTLISLLIYNRELIAQQEYWRLITGHFFHTNLYHLLLNIAGLVLLWSLHGQYYQYKNYCLLILFSAFFVALGLFYFSPELLQYVGLSGILHGVFIWGALMDIRYKLNTGYLLLLGIIIKVTHEQIYGAGTDISDLIEANVAIDAHLWGAISGAVFFLLTLISNTHYQPKQAKTKNADKM